MSPTIAIIGSSGYVGKMITSTFVSALKSGEIGELRLLSRQSADSDALESYSKEGAKILAVDFAKAETLEKAFENVDVVISALGTGVGTKESKSTIISALTTAGVKIYFPSEFGINHYTRSKNYHHEVFTGKKDHYKEATAKGIKTIRLISSIIMEGSFGEWFGLDNKTETWKIIGKGETPVAVTSEADIGRFTLQAVLLATRDLKPVPDLIEFYSDMKTLKEYAEIFDGVAGRKTKLLFTPLKDALAQYEATQHQFEYLLQILFEEGACDFGNAGGNELLNPGEKTWKLKKIQSYAQETQGRPWTK